MKRDLVVLAAMAVMVAILLPSPFATPPFLMGSEETGDLRWYFFQLRSMIAQELADGRWPSWNPYMLGGQPLQANIQSALFYLPNHLMLVLPPWLTFFVLTFLHLWLAGAFTFGLARHYGLSRFGAAIAGVAFMLSSVFVFRILGGHHGDLSTLCWIPLFLWFCDRAVRDDSSGWAGAAGVVFATMVFASHFQHQLFCCTTFLVYFVAHWCVRSRALADLWRLGRVMVIVLVVGVGLAAPQFVPTVEFSGASARAAYPAENKLEFNGANSFPPENLLLLVCPGAFGDNTTLRYWGRWFHYWEMCLYVGLPTLLLLCFSPFSPRRDLVAALAIAAGAALVLASGRYSPLFDGLASLPVYKMLRGYSKFVSEAGLFLCLLAGFGADAFCELLVRQRRRVLIGLLLATIGVSLVYGGAVLAGSSLWHAVLQTAAHHWEPMFHAPLAIEGFAGATGALFTSNLTRTYYIVLLSLFVLLYCAWRYPQVGRLHWLVVLILVVDLISFGRPFAQRTYPVDRVGLDRDIVAYVQAQTTGAGDGRSAPSGDRFRVLCMPKKTELNDPMLDRFENFAGYDNMVIRWFGELVNTAQGFAKSRYDLAFTERLPAVVFRLFNVRYLVTPIDQPCPFPFFTRVHQTARQQLHVFRDCLPRAYLVPSHRVIEDADAARSFLLSPGFRPTREVLLSGCPEGPAAGLDVSAAPAVAAADAAGGAAAAALAAVEAPDPSLGACRVASWGPAGFSVTATVERACWLVLAENHYPGWRATVDGSEVPILRANYCQRAVYVAAGRHTIEFAFRPATHWLGMAIALGTMLLMLLGVLWPHGWAKNKTPGGAAAPGC